MAWLATITKEDKAALDSLAADLDFFINQPGAYYGASSPASLLSALASAYHANPKAVAVALRSLGIVGGGLLSPDAAKHRAGLVYDATHPTKPRKRPA